MDMSRTEEILNTILEDRTDFKDPQSRNEALLIELGKKIDGIDDFEKKWRDKVCPNIYPYGSRGTVGSITKSVARTCSVLKELGIKKVSMLISYETYNETTGLFGTATGVDYQNAVDTIHSYGIKLEQVRFSVSVYGKSNMNSNEKYVNIGTSILNTLSQLGIENEVKIVGCYNEVFSVVSPDPYITGIVESLQTVKNAGYKILVSDGAKKLFSFPTEIVNCIDYYGGNEYPIMSTAEGNRNTESMALSWNMSFYDDYIKLYNQYNVIPMISETGIQIFKDALQYPIGAPTSEIDDNADENIFMYFSALKHYAKETYLLDTIESYNPWYVETWSATDDLKRLWGV